MANLNYTAAQIDALLAKADTAVQPELTGALNNLSTTDKDSLVDAINELVTKEGSLSSLTTTQKASLVAAINELVTNQGTLANLSTTVKTSLVAAINELFQSASDGKTAIAAAITGKGVSTAASDSFATMASNIGQLQPPTYIDPASAKNVQIAPGVNRVATTTPTAISGQTITVSKTGIYDVYWTGYRSSTSGTNGTQLYINGTAYGSLNTTFTNNGQSVHLSAVELNEGDVLTLHGQARTTSYYMYGGNLTIIEA